MFAVRASKEGVWLGKGMPVCWARLAEDLEATAVAGREAQAAIFSETGHPDVWGIADDMAKEDKLARARLRE
eukprot:7251649-Alexandrium_andersonii.AAC.1